MNASELVKRITFSKTYEFLDKNPEQNFLKLVDWLETLNQGGFVAQKLPIIRKYAEDPESNWYHLARSFWNDIDEEVRKTLFTNFMLNGKLLENKKLAENRKKYGCNIPWAISISPTSACNLPCDSSGTAAGTAPLELSFDKMDDLVEQGKQLGTSFYVFAGGEPLLKKDDLIALCNKHADCVFLCVTNGLLVDDVFAEELLRIRNMIPMITVDGFVEETDRWRGAGAFDAARRAMRILKKYRLAFGTCVCCTAQNCDTVSGEAFFDAMIEWGAKATWYYLYLPAGKQGRPELMVSTEQRRHLNDRLEEFWTTKPILAMDFCCSGKLTGGCIAAGRGYCHVSAAGDIEPCAFLQYSDSNVAGVSLLDAYRGPLFQAFHRNQPFDRDPLFPCPLLDHPQQLCTLLKVVSARSTDPLGAEPPEELCGKCTKCAEAWADAAGRR